MTKQLLKDALGWGFLLWLMGYALGMIFFFIAPKELIGWFVMPIGAVITLFVLWKKIKAVALKYYFYLASSWTVIAIVFDYFFLVKALNSADYYKPDVYLYYSLTFLLPLLAGWRKGQIRLKFQD